MSHEYGQLIIETKENQHKVLRADDYIAISLDALNGQLIKIVNDDIVINDEVTYMPLRYSMKQKALVCRRVSGLPDEEEFDD